jgi:hypothetical protein
MDLSFKMLDALEHSSPAVTSRRLLQSSLRFLRSLKDPSVRRSLRGNEPLVNLAPSFLTVPLMAVLICIAAVPLVLVGLVGLAYVLARPELWLWFLLGIPAAFVVFIVVAGICTAVSDHLYSHRHPVPLSPPASGPDQPDFLCGTRRPGSHLP